MSTTAGMTPATTDATTWRTGLSPAQIETVERSAMAAVNQTRDGLAWGMTCDAEREIHRARALAALRAAYPADWPLPREKTKGEALAEKWTVSEPIMYFPGGMRNEPVVKGPPVKIAADIDQEIADARAAGYAAALEGAAKVAEQYGATGTAMTIRGLAGKATPPPAAPG